tara:strand:- start:463 stop:1005 length:543 start_codon:yes stop_codon:yes gene_type:complete
MARNSEIADLGANFPTGHVIQTKYFSTDTAVTSQNTDNTTDSWVDVLTAANITMSSQSNKILILGTGSAAGDAASYEFSWRLVRNIGGGSYSAIGGNSDPSSLMLSDNVFMSGMSTGEGGQTHSSCFLDTPNTTQEIIYKLQLMSGETSTVYANRGHDTHNVRGWANTGDTNITLMEIQQ